MSLGHGASIVRNGLVFHVDAGSVRSYPGTGTNVYDMSGLGNHGVLQNGASVSNGAFVFDGIDDHVNMGDKVDISSGFTLNVWFKGNPTQNDTYAGILNKDASGNFGNYGLYGDVNSTYVRFGFVSTVSEQREISNSSYSDMKTDQWVNYCGTYDQSFLRLYRNGVQITSAAQTETPLANNDTLSFGARIQTASYFNGLISIAQIYNRGLTLDEVQQNFFAYKGRYGL